MSSKNSCVMLRIIALVTVYIFYASYLFVPYVQASDYNTPMTDTEVQDNRTSGNSFATSLGNSYKVDISTDPSSTVPWYNDAQAQQGNYTGYYTNPAGMETAGQSSEARKFVVDSEASRDSYDMTNDPVFGHKCMEKDANGACIKWSSSTSVLYNTYKDCEEIEVQTIDDPQTTKTCTGTFTSSDRTCIFAATPSVTTETITTPCGSTTLDIPAGQILARCQDNYKWYKVDKGQQMGTADGCGAAAFFNWQPTAYEPGAPPANATNFCQYWTLAGCDGDNGIYNIYEWWPAYVNSRVERVSLIESQGGCSDFDEKLTGGDCVITDASECNYARTSCIDTIKDSTATGSTLTDTCAQFYGELDTYSMCLANTYITAGDATFGSAVVSATPQRYIWSTPYSVDLGFARGVQTAYTVTNSRVLGGNDVKASRNSWYSTYVMNCKVESDNCQTLVDEGCWYDSTTCSDQYCTQRIYNYKCGGTGKVTTTEKTVVCAGEVRCLGTECKDSIKTESSSFGDAATAGEVLNNMRVDTAGGSRVFPGAPFECQDEPKNCCDDNVEGVSISDYISAASATYNVAASATEVFAPAAYDAIAGVGETIASYVVPGGIATSFYSEMAGEVVNATFSNVAQNAAYQITCTGLNAIGISTTAGSTAAAVVGTVISALATVLWVVAVLYALYTIISFLYKYMFQCTDEDQATSVKVTLKLCHLVGQKRVNTLGMPLKRRNVYCCFSSMLARIIHEQGRPQVGKSWGTPESPDCSGFTIGEISNLDFSQIDLTEYMDYVKSKTEMNVSEKLESYEDAADAVEDAAITSGKTP